MRPAVIVSASVTDAYITVDLADGRRLAIPTAWSNRLAKASVAARANWQIGVLGEGLSWPDVDEDIGVWTFLGVSEEAVFEANESVGPTRSPPHV